MFLVEYFDHFSNSNVQMKFSDYEHLRKFLDGMGKKFFKNGKMMISSVRLYKDMGEVFIPSPVKAQGGKTVFPPANLGWSQGGVS